jgi:hypothetical protein
MPDRSQSLTSTKNVCRGLILCTALPAQWAVCQPHQMEVPTQGIMPGKKSGNHPGLYPSEGQTPNPGTLTRPRACLGSPQDSTIVSGAGSQPAINPTLKIMPRDHQGRLRPHISGDRAVPREPISSLIASHHCMPRDPIKSHNMLSRDIVQHLLTLANQWGRCSDSPESLQNSLTVRANTYVCP